MSGPIGNYTIGFKCAANTVYSKMDVLVKTSIDPTKIQFAQQYPSAVVVIDVLEEDYDVVFIIEVLNENDIGVPGKYPSQIIINTLNESQHDNIEISILDEHKIFEASKMDGVMTIPVKVIKLLDNTVANITLVIDGFKLTTTYIEFYLGENI